MFEISNVTFPVISISFPSYFSISVNFDASDLKITAVKELLGKTMIFYNFPNFCDIVAIVPPKKVPTNDNVTSAGRLA
jgi:hypothetical protein